MYNMNSAASPRSDNQENLQSMNESKGCVHDWISVMSENFLFES